jgi:glucose-6-phosphate isomerase
MLCGKDFTITATGLLAFQPGITHPETPDVRRLADATPVLFETVDGPGEKPLYYMYRGVYFTADQSLFQKHQIRYDITVLLPGKMNREYIKTVGHVHPARATKAGSFPEYYEVLSGEAIYLLQRELTEGIEVLAIQAHTGDKVYIPPDFGHVTINPGREPLVMANLIEGNFSSLYGPLREKHGAPFYYVDLNGQGYFVKNPYYREPVTLKELNAAALPHPVTAVDAAKPLYEAMLTSPDSFDFLK